MQLYHWYVTNAINIFECAEEGGKPERNIPKCWQ